MIVSIGEHLDELKCAVSIAEHFVDFPAVMAGKRRTDRQEQQEPQGQKFSG